MQFISTHQLLNHPAMKRRMAQRVKINRRYDVPGFAACSRNGRIVYIDRDLSKYHKEARDYAIIRAALVKMFHVNPRTAKIIALTSFNDITSNLIPFIKPRNSLKHLPPDLDLKVFELDQARRIKRRIKRKKALDKARRLDYNKQDGEKNVDRNLYENWLSSLPKNKTNIRK